MLAKRLIPCLDVKDGRVVKGTRFVDLKDAGDPVELARYYDSEGADELVFLDIAASHEGRKTMLDVMERTARQVFIPFTVGGGIGSVEEIRALLQAGADKVSLNTAAVKDPDLISRAAEVFGSQCIVVAVDACRSGGTWSVYTHGGRRDTGMDVLEWVKESEQRGAGEILLTSMDKDGGKSGYDIELTRKVADAVGIPVIASGGAGSLDDFYRVLTEGKADAALAASVFHYRVYTIRQVKDYLGERGVPVRIA